jgi:hypothetical protein
MLLAGPSTAAEEIRVSRGDCASGVRLFARDAHFSDVLKRLSQALDFQLSFEAESDPLVNVDAAMLPGDFVARLAPDANISATQASDPRCPRQTRIVKLWVLAKARTRPARLPPSAQQPAQVQETAEEARETQEVVDFLAKTHGLNPAVQQTSP